MAVSKRLRYEVLRRDNFTCRYCGKKAGETELEVDHVVPVALGGADEASNLVTACTPCNRGKSSSAPDAPIVEGVADDALRWGNAMKEAADLQGRERVARKRIMDRFSEVWDAYHLIADEHLPENERRIIPRPANWDSSIEAFLRAGLEVSDLNHFVDVAMRRPVDYTQTWRYFCGCCWKTIRERQEIAAGLLAVDDEGEE